MITEDEFKLAWLVAERRLSEFPNVAFVIQQYIAELKKQNQIFSQALDDAGWEAAKDMEEREE